MMTECITFMWHTNRRGLWIYTILGCLLGGAIMGGGIMFGVLDNPPVVVESAIVINPVVKRGGLLQFDVLAAPHPRIGCVATITREFRRTVRRGGVDKPEKLRVQGAAPIVHPGELTYVIDIPIPPDLPAGKWAFQGETTFDCGFWSGTKRLRTTEMAIEVIE